MKKKNLFVLRIIMIVLFILSQSLPWEIFRQLISESSSFYGIQQPFQIMFAYLYVVCCILFTSDNERVYFFFKKHYTLYKIINSILNVCIIMCELIKLFPNLIVEILPPTNSKELKNQQLAFLYNIKEYKKLTLLEKSLFLIFIITFFSIFIYTLKIPLNYYSEFMNLIASSIGFLFIFFNIKLP
mgnify:CR=1 FL=1